MTIPLPTAPDPQGNLARRVATRAAFFVAGFLLSSWAPLIPYVKARLTLSDGRLGLLLLCIGAGSLTAMPFAGGWAGRFGCRRVMLSAAAVAGAVLPVVAAASDAAVLAAGLALLGAAIGTLDVVMNIHAVVVERASGRAVMSGFHGMYSVGGIAGAGGVTLLTGAGVPPLTAVWRIVAVSAVLLAATGPGMLPNATGGGPTLALPRGKVLWIGILCAALFLAEGSVLDWGAVFLTSHRHVPAQYAGLGYVAFSVAMTLCRLGGDPLVAALGPRRTLLCGGLCTAAGFVIAVGVPSAGAAIAGFALVGVGAANAVPVLFSAAGRQRAMPTHLAIAAVTTLGYAGILTGPALVGFLAQAAGLTVGFLTIAAMMVVVALNYRAVGNDH